MRRKGNVYAKYGYIFSIPFVLAFLVFTLYPLIYTAIIGFTDLKGLGKTQFNFLENPFDNFKIVLSSPSFQQALKNTVGIWIINFIPQMLLALLFTAWFTDPRHKIKGQGAFKVLFYMPNIITASTIAILFYALFQYPTGPINYLLQALGLADAPINFLVDRWTARLIMAFIQFWMWYGYTMLILISGVLGMNPQMFEAAVIDGASRVQTFFYITLPNLRTILVYTLVTSLVGGLQVFDIPRLFILGGQGGPDNATLTTSLYIYLQAFNGSYMFNRAAAASMIMFVIIAVLSSIVFYILRDRGAEKLRKEIRLAAKALGREAK